MNTAQEVPEQAPFAMAWQHCPWGMATIDGAGNLLQVNPAFESCTGIAAEQVRGMSEADFIALLGAPSPGQRRFEHRRVETAGAGLRAVHYFRPSAVVALQDQRLASLVEAVREPLGSIYGFTELLLTQNYDEETRRELTTTVLEQAEAMSNILNEHFNRAQDGS